MNVLQKIAKDLNLTVNDNIVMINSRVKVRSWLLGKGFVESQVREGRFFNKTGTELILDEKVLYEPRL